MSSRLFSLAKQGQAKKDRKPVSFTSNMEMIADGVWYRKPKLAEITTDRKQSSVRKKDNAKTSKSAKEVENSLFHYGCICKICKEFDEDNDRKRKSVTSAARAQAQDMGPNGGPKVTAPRQVANRKDRKPASFMSYSSVRKDSKPASFTSNISVRKDRKPASFTSNIFSVLMLDDPGNSPQVSSHRKCCPSPKRQILRGGAKTKAIGMKPIFEMAVKVAENHGIKVTPDHPNPATGDCLFESILDNINHRPDDFPEKFEDGVDSYRELFVTELEERYKDKPVFPGYNGTAMTDEELGQWTAAWTQQKNPREFNVDEFNVSDLTPLGLGHCIRRNILVLSNVPNEEVRVFDARLFEANLELTTEVPVVIAYDSIGSGHYESLLPKTKTDVKKCTMLTNAILSKSYDRDHPADYLDKAKKARRAEAAKQRRSQEEPAAKKARLDKDKANKTETRQNEKPKETKARKEKDKAKKSETREKEADEARHARNRKAAERKQKAEGITCHPGELNSAKRGQVPGRIEPLDLGQMDPQNG